MLVLFWRGRGHPTNSTGMNTSDVVKKTSADRTRTSVQIKIFHGTLSDRVQSVRFGEKLFDPPGDSRVIGIVGERVIGRCRRIQG